MLSAVGIGGGGKTILTSVVSDRYIFSLNSSTWLGITAVDCEFSFPFRAGSFISDLCMVDPTGWHGTGTTAAVGRGDIYSTYK